MGKGRRWNIERAKILAIDTGYILIENTFINGSTSCTFMCKEGYKYIVIPCKYDSTRGKLGKFYKNNPYYIYNLELYLKILGYDYKIESKIYVSSTTKINFSCKIHGSFKLSIQDINRGKKCPRCDGRIEKYNIWNLKQIKEDLINNYNLELMNSKFINRNIKITVMDNKGFLYEVIPNTLRHRKRKLFIVSMTNPYSIYNLHKWLKENRSQLKLIDNKYVRSDSKMNFICKEHGKVKISWSKLQQGAGCPICGGNGMTTIFSANKNKVEWKNIQSGIYILRLYNKNENFYKIGIASNGVKARYPKGRMPYNYEIILERMDISKYDACYLETNLKHLNKVYKYNPKIRFKGDTECFSNLVEYDYNNILVDKLNKDAYNKRLEFENNLIKKYCNGNTFGEIAKQVNFSKPFIVNIVTKKHGVEKAFSVTYIDKSFKIFKYQKGISDYFGVPRGVVQDICKSQKPYKNKLNINYLKGIEGIIVKKVYIKNGKLFNYFNSQGRGEMW